VPDIEVRHHRGSIWREARLQSLLDPSRFVLLVNQGDDPATPDPALTAALAGSRVPVALIELGPPASDAIRTFHHEVGSARVMLVRPDGYVAMAAGRAMGPTVISASSNVDLPHAQGQTHDTRQRANPLLRLTAAGRRAQQDQCARCTCRLRWGLGEDRPHSRPADDFHRDSPGRQGAGADRGAPTLCLATDIFPRMSASPFSDHATAQAMRAHDRRTLVIAGFATEVASLHAALDAIKMGYAAQFPVDANGGMSARSDDAAFRQIERAGGVTTSVVTLATTLAPDFATNPGTQVLQRLRQNEVVADLIRRTVRKSD
jgi:nicotinamidase-related amidase